jgi:glutaredoxin
MKATVYSMAQCSYCVDAKQLLDEHNIEYEEVLLGVDMYPADFMKKFPGVMSVPVIVMNEKQINGYNELKEELNNG